MTGPVRPRRLAHRGAVVCAGLWFDRGLLGEAEARRRALARWQRGASVRAVGGGLALLLEAPQRLPVGRVGGIPLVRAEGVWWGAPLSREERAAAGAQPGQIALVVGGALTLERGVVQDPSTWLDVGGFEVLEVAPLLAPPAPPADALAAPPVDARERLSKAVGQAHEGRASLLEALAGARGRARGAEGDEPGSAGKAVGQAGGGAAGAAGAGSARSGAAGSAAGGAGGAGEAGQGAEPRLPWWQRVLESLRTSLLPARWSALARWLGRRQAEYLRDLLERFEAGDIDEALRRAIPLAGEAGEALRQGFSTPRPRSDLKPSAQAPRGGGGGLAVGPDLFTLLKRYYRQSFERLEREGRIEEAAFVLLELLGEVEEAVAFLEQHQRYDLAASIAEGRGLPPERVVRLWWLAGERERAVLVARRHRAFAGAVARLEAGHADAAEALRWRWAEHLEALGDLAGAVEVLGLGEAPADLLEAAMDRGDERGQALLGQAVLLRPTLAEPRLARMVALLKDASPGRAPERAALLEGLVTPGPERISEPLRPLLRLATRTLARDLTMGPATARASLLEPFQRQQLVRLAERSADAALLAEARSAPLPRRFKAGPVHLRLPDRRGAVPILDAVALPARRLMVACGDAGVWVLGEGSRPRYLDAPAHELAVAREGGRVIAVARRGGVCQLHTITTGDWRVTPWQDARLRRVADSFSEGVWFVAEDAPGGAVAAIDVTAAGWRSLWRVSDLAPGGRVRLIRAGRSLEVLLDIDGEIERWRYELPSLTLRERGAVSRDGLLLYMDAAEGAVSLEGHHHGDGLALVLNGASGARILERGPAEPGWLEEVTAMAAGASRRVAVARLGEVEIYEAPGWRVVGTLSFGAAVTKLRWQGEQLIAIDSRGRAAVYDAMWGTLRGIYTT